MYSGVPITWPNSVIGGVLGEPLRRGLGDAEVDDLRDPFIVLRRDEDVGRLDVAVDDPLLMRVLHAFADVHEQDEASFDGEAVLVAVIGDRNAGDVLHREVRTPFRCRAGVVDTGDVGMVHQRQRLALGVEAGEDFPGVHAPLDQLERHRPAHRALLLGLVDDAHATFADLAQDPVWPDALRTVSPAPLPALNVVD